MRWDQVGLKDPGNSEVCWVLCWAVEGSLISRHLSVAYFEDLQEGMLELRGFAEPWA